MVHVFAFPEHAEQLVPHTKQLAPEMLRPGDRQGSQVLLLVRRYFPAVQPVQFVAVKEQVRQFALHR